MRPLQLSLVALLALNLTACSYSKAMKHGEAAASQGNWPEAVVEYQKALQAKAKNNEDAMAAFMGARDEAIEGALDNALISLDRGAYESAMTEFDYVVTLDTDNADVFTLRTDLKRKMEQDIEAHWGLGNVRTSYTTAVRMRALFPRAEMVATFEMLRGYYVEQAEERLGEKRFEDALASARTIVEFEPNRESHVAPLEHKILNGWADDQTRQAWKHQRAGRKGAAAMMYARAYEIAGRRTDLEKAQDLASDLGDRGTFSLDLRVTGASSRTDRIRGILDGATGQLKDLTTGGKASLSVTVAAASATCKEEKTATPETKDYISGQIEVANPKHGELTQRLADAGKAAAKAKAESESLWPAVQQTEQSLKWFDNQLAQSGQARTAAAAQLSQAQSQLNKINAARQEAVDHLVELRAVGPGVEATIARREKELEGTAQLLAEWQGAVMMAEMAVGNADAELQRIQIERQPAAEALDRISGGYNAVLGDWQNFQKLASDTKSELARTSKTVMEDVHETLSYDVLSWTRTCTAPVSVSMRPAWRTEELTTNRYAPVGVTRDTSHIGHAKAGLTEDPKEYPEADADLFATGDAASAKEIGTWIGTMLEDYYETRTLEATSAMQRDPLKATDLMLNLYLGAPGHMDEATVLTFKSHAKQQFGLESLELLSADHKGRLAVR